MAFTSACYLHSASLLALYHRHHYHTSHLISHRHHQQESKWHLTQENLSAKPLKGKLFLLFPTPLPFTSFFGLTSCLLILILITASLSQPTVQENPFEETSTKPSTLPAKASNTAVRINTTPKQAQTLTVEAPTMTRLEVTKESQQRVRTSSKKVWIS